MWKLKVNRRIFHSKVLVFALIFSFVLLIVTDASPRKGDFDSGEEFKPIVRVKEASRKQKLLILLPIIEIRYQELAF